INTAGATSKAYIDARWEVEAPSGIFFALGIGGAIHDGKLEPTDADRKALGSRLLFHFPVELGYRFDGHSSISVYFEHISNGYTQAYNEGLDAIGVRYGYRF
ncbi:MAG: acyloxyacyl hydrolase, partial [Proteobacteria bacterium]|nr:acyloxyacyl hydrolase [Pseudomonadota bacterium]